MVKHNKAHPCSIQTHLVLRWSQKLWTDIFSSQILDSFSLLSTEFATLDTYSLGYVLFVFLTIEGIVQHSIFVFLVVSKFSWFYYVHILLNANSWSILKAIAHYIVKNDTKKKFEESSLKLTCNGLFTSKTAKVKCCTLSIALIDPAGLRVCALGGYLHSWPYQEILLMDELYMLLKWV